LIRATDHDAGMSGAVVPEGSYHATMVGFQKGAYFFKFHYSPLSPTEGRAIFLKNEGYHCRRCQNYSQQL
jgi:hypothetical protein